MKTLIGLALTTLFSSSAIAGHCPNFAGDYMANQGDGTPTTWTQTGCKIVTRSDGGDPMILDGREHVSYSESEKVVEVWTWNHGEIHGLQTEYHLRDGGIQRSRQRIYLDAQKNLVLEAEMENFKFAVHYKRIAGLNE